MNFGGRAAVKQRKELNFLFLVLFVCLSVFEENQFFFFSDPQGWMPHKELLADVEHISFSKGFLN